MSDGSDRIVYRIEKRDGEEIRATLKRYRGTVYAHLRVFYRAEDGEFRPTQKGISLSADRFDELELAIGALRRAIEAGSR